MSKEPEVITVTELRNMTREIIERAHFRNQRYIVERAGQPMVVIVGVEDFQRLTTTVPHSEPIVTGRTSMPNL